jgi:pyruvate/2-oxoglutarate dehydrogenase complex dihydrolipoamide dehydrogenase (E3) component
MSKTVHEVDLCVIGAGSAGLSVAYGASHLGRSVVLFERENMGGDCLNTGCVPSKALIKAAKVAHDRRHGAEFGIAPVEPEIDFQAVKAHIQGVIDQIAPVDSVERYSGFGVTVLSEDARFEDDQTIVSDNHRVRAKRIVVAAGSRASAPPIPGLADVPYLTNERIFQVPTLPKHLLIIGSGPIGLEMGQSFRRLGSKVTIIDIAEPLGRSDPDHAQILMDALRAEGVDVRAPVKTKLISKTARTIKIEFEDGETVTGSHLLVAAGRAPNVETLALDKGGITYDRTGIDTDEALRTSNPRVYAAGDIVAGKGGLTHAAGHHAGALIKNLYFMPPGLGSIFAKATTNRMPAVIYTQPELGTIGAGHADAAKTVHFDFSENDRSIAERDLVGGVKLYLDGQSKIIGASCVGSQAGEIINTISLAMAGGLKLSQITAMISPYPTRTEVVKRAASSHFTAAIFGPKAKALSGFWTKFQK